MKKLALLVVAFLLLVAAAYYLYRRAPADHAGPVPELVALAPHKAEWIVYVDLVAWRNSPMLEHLRRLAPDGHESTEYRQFVDATGFDYSRDLDQLVVALVPYEKQSSPRTDFQTLAIADGRFSRKRITDHALKNGSRETHNDQEVLVIRDAASPARGRGEETLLLFLTEQRVALADAGVNNPRQSVQARELVLAAAQPLSKTAPLTPLAERAARVTGAPFFATGRADAVNDFGGALKGDHPMMGQAAQVLSTVKWLTIAARPEQDHVRLSVFGECESAWQATQLGFLLDGLLALARGALQEPRTRERLSPRELEHAEAILTTIRVERRGSVVEIRMEVSADALALAASGGR